MAEYIFSVDADVRVCEEVKADTKKYAKAVENRIMHCKYREVNLELGRTGADKLLSGFPAWKRLHGFWRTLPSFNPHSVSSEPGQDLEGDAMETLFGNQVNGRQDADGGTGAKEPDGLQEECHEEHTGTPGDCEVDNMEAHISENEPKQQPAAANTPVALLHLPTHFRAQSVSSSADQSSRSAGPSNRLPASAHVSRTPWNHRLTSTPNCLNLQGVRMSSRPQL
ncbi:hypothetical protein EDB84DRAFT_1440628 [Lactarius hengduanensis]|nr:hypothetical protein EDB84DRAFT_1440628 [Lactarius hengduanensis]